MSARLENCLAPAKLNLFLHVIGRRADGYHLLQSVFQLLDRGDILHVETSGDERIRRMTDIAGVPEEADLVVRAARLLRDEARARGIAMDAPGARIWVEKRLPMGGGLGGGSSDAATTLLALNHLWNIGLSRADLMQLGLRLGADVPFFLFGRNAFAEGVGEALQPVDTPARWYLVIEPGVSVPTATIFASPELTRDSERVRITDFSSALSDASKGFGKNDLQVVAARLYPQIDDTLRWLSNFGDARMTGSGACVFCAFEHEQQARQALDEALAAGRQHWKAWIAQAMERHPLSHLLKS